MQIQFSIITVSLNHLDGLQRTQESLQPQTCQDFEWIVIDGGSEDESADFLKTSICDQWCSEADAGLYDAMNKGIERASGRTLLFLNAGDTLADKTVLARIQAASASNPAFIYGDALENTHYKKARPHTQITYGFFTHHQSMFYNREALGTLRYGVSYKLAADYDLTARFLQKHPDQALYCPFPVCIFEGGGLSQTKARQGRREQFQIRQRLKLCPLWKNIMIYGTQALRWALRQASPNLYWRLKSSGNNANDFVQNQSQPSHPENQA